MKNKEVLNFTFAHYLLNSNITILFATASNLKTIKIIQIYLYSKKVRHNFIVTQSIYLQDLYL